MKVGDKLYCYKDIFNDDGNCEFKKGNYYKIISIKLSKFNGKKWISKSIITLSNKNGHYYMFYKDKKSKFNYSEYFYTERELREKKLKKLKKLKRKYFLSWL